MLLSCFLAPFVLNFYLCFFFFDCFGLYFWIFYFFIFWVLVCLCFELALAFLFNCVYDVCVIWSGELNPEKRKLLSRFFF